jgi:hypothetical protein
MWRRTRLSSKRLAAVADPLEALEPGAPLVHPDLGSNRCFSFSLGGGDLSGLGAPRARFGCLAGYGVRRSLRAQRENSTSLIPSSCLSDKSPDPIFVER